MSFLIFSGLWIASKYVILIVRQISKKSFREISLCVEDKTVRIGSANSEKLGERDAVIFFFF